MSVPPTLPIILLALGALAVAASDLARLRRPSLIMVIFASLALMTTLLLRSDPPATQIVSGWQPISVFGAPLSFQVDQTGWLIAMGLALTGLATAFTWLAYPGQQRPAPRALSLVLIAAALVSVFASNLPTLLVAWGLFDLAFIAALLVRSGPQVGRRAAVAIILNTSATVCVWIAALLIGNAHGSVYWRLLELTPEARAWLIAAAVLRVGLYPLHQWLPIESGQEPDRAVLLFTIPAAVGFALWMRLSITSALPADSIVQWLAVVSVVIGAMLAYYSSTPRHGLPFLALSFSGLALIDVVTFNTPAIITAAALNWLFVTASLFIAHGLDRRAPWWSIGVLIAGLSLSGVPGTLGFVVRGTTIAHLIGAGQWPILLVSVLAEILLVAATIRVLLTPSTEAHPIQPVRQAAFAIAIAGAALPLITVTMMPTLIPGLPSLQTITNGLSFAGWVMWLLPIVGGGAIALTVRRPTTIQPNVAPPIWTRVLRLDWINIFAAFIVERMTGLLRGLSGVVEGEGGLIWSMIFVIVGLVLAAGALK
jgi:formate hydrogenlyase subunit 3/multisubunit Na+/H+ antiporter MnhD subunit